MTAAGGVAGERLRSLIEWVERLEEEIKALNQDKSEIYKEASGQGFDVKAMKKIVALRRIDEADREEQDALVDTYLRAIGMKPERAGRRAADSGTEIASRAGARAPAREAETEPAAEPAVKPPAPKGASGAGALPARAIPDGIEEIEITEETALTAAVRGEIVAAGFVEVAPGRFRAPATEPAVAVDIPSVEDDPRFGATTAAPAPVPAVETAEAVYEAGYQARGAGVRVETNPHPPDDDPLGAYTLWRQGWRDRDDESRAAAREPEDALAF